MKYDNVDLDKNLLFEYYETEADIAVYSITHKPTGIAANERVDMRRNDNIGFKEIQTKLILDVKKQLISRENNKDFSLSVRAIDGDYTKSLYMMTHSSGATAEMAVHSSDMINVSEVLRDKIINKMNRETL